MRVYFGDDMGVEFPGYYLGYPTKVMEPESGRYYEFAINSTILYLIETESEIDKWLRVNVGDYKDTWDMHHTQVRRTELDYSMNTINQYYIRFRHEEHAIEFKMRWL